jgi:hypothetical protein
MMTAGGCLLLVLAFGFAMIAGCAAMVIVVT